MTDTNRLGISPKTAIKAPISVATTANITLSGSQTIDSVAVVAGDRVLVKDQTDASENGIYDVSETAWTRSKDWNADDDAVSGVLIIDSGKSVVYMVTFTGGFSLGTTTLTFTNIFDIASNSATAAAASAAAALISQLAAAASETAAGLSQVAAAASETAAAASATSMETILSYSFAEQVGSDLNITGNPVEVSMCALYVAGGFFGLLPTAAYFDTANGELRAYEFNGSSCSLVGSGFAIASVGASDMCAIASGRIGFVDDGNDTLRMRVFNGTTWSNDGAALSLNSSIANPSISTMSTGDFTDIADDYDYGVAIADDGQGIIKAYGYPNGGDWEEVGDFYSFIGTFTKPSLVTIDANLFAVVDEGSNEIKVLSWGGETAGFTLEATHSTGLTLGDPSLVGLVKWAGGYYLTLCDSATDKMYPYFIRETDGGGWSILKAGAPTALGSVGRAVISFLDESSVFYIDETNDDLRAYRFPYSINYNRYA